MKYRAVKHLAQTQDQAIAAARRYVQHILEVARDLDADTQKQLLLNSLPSIAQEWGQVAAESAARWYEEQRLAALGDSTYTAKTVTLGPEFTDRIQRGVTAVAGGLYGKDGSIDNVAEPVNTMMDSAIRSASRSTVARNIESDPSGPAWARYAEAGACPFCIAVASQGVVYKSEEKADGQFHDHCRCQAVPVWSKKADDVSRRSTECLDAYSRAQRDYAREYGEYPSSKETINWMRRNGDKYAV